MNPQILLELLDKRLEIEVLRSKLTWLRVEFKNN